MQSRLKPRPSWLQAQVPATGDFLNIRILFPPKPEFIIRLLTPTPLQIQKAVQISYSGNFAEDIIETFYIRGMPSSPAFQRLKKWATETKRRQNVVSTVDQHSELSMFNWKQLQKSTAVFKCMRVLIPSVGLPASDPHAQHEMWPGFAWAPSITLLTTLRLLSILSMFSKAETVL